MKRWSIFFALVAVILVIGAVTIAPSSDAQRLSCPPTYENPDGSTCELVGYGFSMQGIYECTHEDGSTYVGYGPCFG